MPGPAAASSAVPPPPRKHLGQHFLVDPNIARKMVTAAALRPRDVVFEIGPGRGALTRLLCERAAKVIAVEIDRQLVRYLSAVLAGDAALELHHGDAMTFACDELPKGTVVIANVPYAVSTPLLFRLLRARDRISRMVLMLQREVAARILAAPGSRDYGVLSVMSRYYAEPRKAFAVPASCFRPVPDVDSAVVTFVGRSDPRGDADFDRVFAQLVRGAFAHRRKTLMNSWREEGWDPASMRRILEHAGIDPRRRAETLGVPEFLTLAQAVSVDRAHPGPPPRRADAAER